MAVAAGGAAGAVPAARQMKARRRGAVLVLIRDSSGTLFGGFVACDALAERRP